MKLSVIMPTLDEEEALAAALAHVRAGARPRLVELVVADGGSKDGTLAAARASADLALALERPGRAYQMHCGALAATGDILLFLHADTRLPEGWLDMLLAAWRSRPRPGSTAFQLGFDHPAAFYRVIERIAAWRSRLTGVPFGDQGIAVAREAYLASGGFPDVPIMEEYYLLRKLRRIGPIRILPGRVRTSVRRYERGGRVRRSLRNVLITGLFHLGMRPRALARLYR
ncbi:MAG: TIGR04283 family arsenosugar biosynthesis glycosyltransferase [Elusimicrobia bacterium]|nr:TIGR04283 family arsenosugar biosynthesis glycosyltransferase [Elusimicrobiota bacterium]